MFIALDKDFNRVHIKDTNEKNEYYCPYCNCPLETKKGQQRRHHFAHAKKGNRENCDSWLDDRNQNAYKSTWHDDWQNKFPLENQEIKLSVGNVKHRADIFVGRTVIEFQHSPLTIDKFSNRNKFYSDLGHKVVWLFDFIDEFKEGKITFINNQICNWSNPKRTFGNYDEIKKELQIELYFQIEDNKILKLIQVFKEGFKKFKYKALTADSFLKQFRLKDGSFPLPEPEDINTDPNYQEFKKNYGIELNQKQERAVQAVSGANLLLAVPGSGKTTTLITRIGYMVHQKNIKPSTILAMTYTKKAAEEMTARYIAKFGDDGVVFKTINAVAEEIIKYYCYLERKYNERPQLINDAYEYLKKAYMAVLHKIPTGAEIKQLGTEVTRVKNNSELRDFQSFTNKFKDIKNAYDDLLKQDNKMDFDDQILFAVQLMKNVPKIAKHFQDNYHFLCVDESQDTSHEQHKLIKLLFKDNIFMVGDEDQSIYSFRGAYPRALINFETIYPNPYVLRMEVNYRSYKKIIDISNEFIRRNRNRHEKAMIADRQKDGTVTELKYSTRKEEIQKVFALCKDIKEETAILYRDSDCAICLIAMLLKNNVKFNLLQNSITFFTSRTVLDILSCISLSINHNDEESFRKIYNRTNTKFKKQEMENAIKVSRGRGWNIVDTLEEFNVYYKPVGKEFISPILQLSKMSPKQAVESAYDILGKSKIERYANELAMLADNTSTLPEFLEYINNLKNSIEQFEGNRDSLLTLSTIHSAKGMEFKNVIILDVIDGFIPKNPEYLISTNEDKKDEYQEERRLFYVAMTRAKDNLYISRVTNTSSSFCDEIFGTSSSLQCPERSKKPSNLKGKNNTFKNKEYYELDIDFEHCTQKDKFIKSSPPDINIEYNSFVDIGEERYFKKEKIFHKNLGTGKILKFDFIGENKIPIVQIQFDNGKVDKFPLDSCVKSGIIKKI